MAGGAHRLTFTAKKPRFSTLFLPGMAQNRCLAVPELFAKEYGDRLSNRVVFKLPNGVEWPIGLSRSGSKIWFSEGWRQFADFYSINSMGYLLVFEYLGNSRFLVVIFDHSTSEIRYPMSRLANNGADVAGECGDEKDDDDSVEISYGYSSSPETRHEPPLNNCSWLPNLKKGLVRGSSSEATPDEVLPSDSVQEVEETLSAAKKAIALTRARAAFRSDKPFFMLVMQPSFVYAPMGCNLHLPVDFSEIYFKENCGETVLQLHNGKRAWVVECFVAATAGKNRVCFLHQSWHAFAKDTNLKVGDVCAFELMEGGTIPTLQVTIFHAAKGSGSLAGGNSRLCKRTLSAGLSGKGVLRRDLQSSELAENSGRKPAIFVRSSEAATPYNTSMNPSFKLTVATSHVQRNFPHRNWRMRVPKSFASNIEADAREAELWVEGSYWQVKIGRELQKGKESINLAGGWRRFAEDNSLQVGDVCVFELVGTKEDCICKTMKFNVCICRGE